METENLKSDVPAKRGKIVNLKSKTADHENPYFNCKYTLLN